MKKVFDNLSGSAERIGAVFFDCSKTIFKQLLFYVLYANFFGR